MISELKKKQNLKSLRTHILFSEVYWEVAPVHCLIVKRVCLEVQKRFSLAIGITDIFTLINKWL